MIKILKKVLAKFLSFDLLRKRCKIVNHGTLWIRKDIIGYNNFLIVDKSSILNRVTIKIHGNSNKIVIGKNVKIGHGCSIWIEGNNITASIGDNCTFTHDSQICVQEDNNKVTIGDDCMFSHHVNIRTSDSHIIYDIHTNTRLNPAKSVTIGNHVWIAPCSTVMKGVTIEQGSIIGTNSIVTKNIPPFCLAVGMPAHVVKDNISWKRDMLF